MARNLRRSRRGGNTIAKKTSAYDVNEIVEIVRGNATVKGRLAQLLSDPYSPNPRWLIKFDGLSLKDEEVYEHTFAKDNQSPSSDNSSSDRESCNGRRSTRGTSDLSPLPSEADSETGGESNRSRAKRALAREARSRRRQAKIETSGPNTNKRRLPPPPPNHHSRQKGKRARHGSGGGSHHGNNRGNNSNGNNSNNASGADDEEDVVKVKLLTGTLYMYRGLHRRAEFVRRV